MLVGLIVDSMIGSKEIVSLNEQNATLVHSLFEQLSCLLRILFHVIITQWTSESGM